MDGAAHHDLHRTHAYLVLLRVEVAAFHPALLGLQGLVFKSHGSADAFAFEQALGRAYDAAHNHLLDNVRERIAHAQQLISPESLPSELKSIPTL